MDDSKDIMELPYGKTCGDCAHVYRCALLFSARSENRECDFYPIRFVDKVAGGQDGTLPKEYS
jgi:hypothetical protein